MRGGGAATALTPGQTVLFLERVQTEALAPTAAGVLVGTSSGVVLVPQATLGTPGDECKVQDSRMGYRKPASYVRTYFGRVINNPFAV